MSSLDSGFVRQTVGYADNDFFPITSLVPKKHGKSLVLMYVFSDVTTRIRDFLSGQDPIIGGPPPEGSPGVPRQAQYIGGAPTLTSGDQVDIRLTGGDGSNIAVSGFTKVTVPGTEPPPGEPNPFFVTSRGGEYFFVPSVSTLKTWANDASALL